MQLIVLPAAVALEPATALMVAILLVAYVSVHWTPAGSLPAGELNDKFSATAPPGAAAPDDNVSVFWPNATPVTTASTRARKELRVSGLRNFPSTTLVRNWSTSRKSGHLHPAQGALAYVAACRPANSKVFSNPFVFNAIFGECGPCRWCYAPCSPRLGKGDRGGECHAQCRLAWRRGD